MTRFARAKGSKASNERVPENATPWKIMKEDMERKKREKEENKEREKMNDIRQKNYDEFISKKESEVETEWAEFPDDDKKSKPKITKKEIEKTKNKKNKIIKNKSSLINDMKEMLKPDPEIDWQVEKMTSKIEKILDENSKKRSYDSNDDSDAPEEISAKVESPKIKVKKPKVKKTSLKIPQINSNMNTTENLESTELKKSKKKSRRAANTEQYDNDVITAAKDSEKKEVRCSEENQEIASEAWSNSTTTGQYVCNPNIKNQDENRKFQKKQQKLKVAKVRDNKEHIGRKPNQGVTKMIFNGKEVDVVKFDGFPVKKQDADRLSELRKQMISKGIPFSEVKRTMQLERRRAEKALSREKKKVCFHCRKSGHMLSECPELDSQQVAFTGIGICFKCGSTEHTHFECKVNKSGDYKFATCFICKEQGHIARQCPDNPKGLYPHGGACKLCGDVTHMKKDCPQETKQKEDDMLFLKTLTDGNIDSLDDDMTVYSTAKKAPEKRNIIKF